MKDTRTVQERWQAAQNTADGFWRCHGTDHEPGCMGGAIESPGVTYTYGWYTLGDHRAVASMQLDGIACEDLP